jgi:hypothetical protein
MICGYYGSNYGLQSSVDRFIANGIVDPSGYVVKRTGLTAAVGGTAVCGGSVGAADLAGIRAQLDAGRPVEAWDNSLPHHYVVVGYVNGGTTQASFRINDPASGTQKQNPYSIHGYFTYSGTPSTGTIPDNTFVQLAGAPEIYRVAGGAPLYVSSWNAFGGPQPTTALSQAQFNSLRSVPADGTLINSTATGRVYIMAGGAPLYVSSWAAIGGSRPSVAIDQWCIDNITHPLAHMRARPADGTLVCGSGDGCVYIVAGGAPLYVSNFAAIGGARPVVGIDQWCIDNSSDPHAHLNAVPENGTFLNTSTGSVYRVAGGAPIAVSSWSVFGGMQPYVTVDQWCIDNITDPHAHLNALPADGTWLRAEPKGEYYVVAGGAPVFMGPMATFLSMWASRGGPAPNPAAIDGWSIANAGTQASHMRMAPSDGTIVRGLPSDAYWSFGSGLRTPAAASSSAVWVADVGLAAFPIYAPDTTPPSTTVSGADDLWHNSPVTLTLTAIDNAGGSGMSGGQAKAEYKLNDGSWTVGTSLTVPAPPNAKTTHTILYRSTDNAGNVEVAKSCTVKIDTTGAPVPVDTTSPTTTVHGADGLWHTAAVALSLTAEDIGTDASGVAFTEYKLDDGVWTRGTSLTVAAPAGVRITHTVLFRSQDNAGNLEEAKSCTVKIDTTGGPPPADPPTTTASGFDNAWHRSPVTVSFSALPSIGGLAVAYTEYRLDGDEWTRATSVTVPAFADHSADGVHTIAYRSADIGVPANVEDERTCTVMIDTLGPRTAARSVSVRRGSAVSLRYYLADLLSFRAAAVKVVVKNSRGATVKSASLGERTTDTWYSLRWTPKARGTYRYYVYGKDLAGNAQTKVGSAKVVVR